ncbi:uncharacterized protein EKO05_0006106 [Ascochyta rabiei]|uniref:Uncharacterized protein n=1 Tax=Didymella rabiei TaxID=5454 RepID=A0A163MKW2_DIDRA|nr:uncharacterized protein EKO05_0006106 [Ascochyta rabiei]KZM28803.1 hypothetical protein ST47_g64 [Ascochyta rabiei]UPX15665.1 hypothetical protein EKO05_0006106 [Ascochyta rabiei]
MRLNLFSAALLGQCLVAAQDLANVTWPNSFPKQIAAVRRREGLTTSEFQYHHIFVHGRKAWNAPDTVDQPLAYVQDHVFDSAYGINTTKNSINPSYFGHSDMTELYSRSQDAFATPPPNNYTSTIIGPDGAAFSDFSASVNMYAHEVFYPVNSSCQHPIQASAPNAFYWIFANASNANTSSFENATFAGSIMDSLVSAFPPGAIYNASIHTSVAGMDSRGYYGGYNNPTLNAVLKFWLCDDHQAITAFRKAQSGLISQNEKLQINLDNSFVIFTRPILIYDRTTNTPFDTARAQKALLTNGFSSNAIVAPLNLT